MDLMVGATYENIMMVEGEMDEVSEADLLEALKAAHEAIKVHCLVQKELAEAVGSTVKREYCHETNDEELRKDVWANATTKHTLSHVREMPTSMPAKTLSTRLSTNT